MQPDTTSAVRKLKLEQKTDDEIRTILAATGHASEDITKALAALQYMRPLDTLQKHTDIEHSTETKPTPFFASLITELAKFIFGTIGIGILAATLAGLFWDGIIASNANQKFIEIEVTFKLLLFFVPTMLPFVILSFITGKFILLSYPILTFFIAPTVRQSDLVQYIANITPLDGVTRLGGTPPQLPSVFVAVVVTFMLIHIAATFVQWLLNRRQSTLHTVRLLIIGATTIVCVAVFIMARPLYYDQQRATHSMRLATKASGDSVIFIKKEKDQSLSYTTNSIYIPNKKGITADKVTVKHLKKHYDTSLSSNCGVLGQTYIDHKGIPAEVKHLRTTKNIAYTELNFISETYTDYNYCFVEGRKVYELSRVKETIEFQPTSDFIDTISSADILFPNCADIFYKNKPFYCTDIDKDRDDIRIID